MTRKQLIEFISDYVDIREPVVKSVLDALGAIAQEEIPNGRDIPLPGIGKLKLVERAARTGRNPQTGEAIEIPAKKAVKFAPAKSLKEALR